MAAELGELMSRARKAIEVINISKTTDLSPSQFRLLSFISNHPATTVGAISNAMSINQSSVTNLVSRLHKKGLVTKRGLRSDRRLVRVSLTESGSKMLEDLRAHRAKLLSKILDSMPKNEQKKLLDGLDGFVRAAHRIGILGGGACLICGSETLCDCARSQVQD